MTRLRFHARYLTRLAAPLVVAAPLLAGVATAQERGLLDNLFSRGQQQEQQTPGPVAQSDAGDLAVRLDRMENALRQLTGTIEQLQYRNQQLEMRLQRLQDDTEYRLQRLGSKGGPPPAQGQAQGPAQAPARAMPMPQTPAAPMPAQAPSGRRSDVFDPSQHPNAPGAPRTLGNGTAAIVAPEPAEQPVGAPGGRAAGAPLDLTTLSANPPAPPADAAPATANAGPVTAAPMPAMPNNPQLPPPPARNTSATGTQLATLPPSASPKDEYDMAYGYVLHKDYALAEQAFRDFVRKHPDEKLVPDAQYWLGESLFQRQRYRDAAESFLAVSTRYEHSGKAPDALLRLGQSLAAMHQKEAACATLAEVGRKYPRASASVKRGAAQEIKRAHC
jgi:tol-pal system protein YbgF